MPSPITITTRVPLPPHLAPETVLQALHAFEPLITANPYVVGYERRAVPVSDLVGDLFFRDDGRALRAFTVHDRVPVIPGVAWATKAVTVPCVFQSFDRGVRCRADAQAGVTVRSSYEVRRRGEVPYDDDAADVAAAAVAPGAAEGFELLEIAQIECGTLVKAFVKRSFASAHQEILQRLVDQLVLGGVGRWA